MITEQILIITSAIGVITLLLQLVGSTVYDLHATRHKKQLARHPFSRRYRVRQLVTVLIMTHNDESTIEDCLKSLTANGYRKIETVIVDAASTDDTKDVIRRYQANHPKQSIKLMARKTAGSRSAALLAGLKAHAKGELVLVMNPSSTLDKAALKTALDHFNSRPEIELLRLNRRVRPAYSVAGLVQKYIELLGQRAKKLASVSNSDYLMDDEALYRRPTLLASLRRPADATQPRSYYADDVTICAESPRSFGRLFVNYHRLQMCRLQALKQQYRLAFGRHSRNLFLTWVRLPLVILNGLAIVFVPFLAAYFVYLAVRLDQPLFLIIGLAATAGVLFFAVWDDAGLKFRHKLAYVIGIPITFAPLLLLCASQLAVIIRAAGSSKKYLEN